VNQYRFSLFFLSGVVVINLLYNYIENKIIKLTAANAFSYGIFGLFALFFGIAFYKVLKKKNLEIAVLLLAGLTILFFLFSPTLFSNRLNILLFFISGLIISLESKQKNKSIFPFLIILVGCLAAELIHNLAAGTDFFIFDVWRNYISGMCGLVIGLLLF
jgi:hypothetical protein